MRLPREAGRDGGWKSEASKIPPSAAKKSASRSRTEGTSWGLDLASLQQIQRTSHESQWHPIPAHWMGGEPYDLFGYSTFPLLLCRNDALTPRPSA
jgi:hypothetical protein